MTEIRERVVRALQTVYRHGYEKGASGEACEKFDPSIAAESYMDTKPGVVADLLAAWNQRPDAGRLEGVLKAILHNTITDVLCVVGVSSAIKTRLNSKEGVDKEVETILSRHPEYTTAIESALTAPAKTDEWRERFFQADSALNDLDEVVESAIRTIEDIPEGSQSRDELDNWLTEIRDRLYEGQKGIEKYAATPASQDGIHGDREGLDYWLKALSDSLDEIRPRQWHETNDEPWASIDGSMDEIRCLLDIYPGADNPTRPTHHAGSQEGNSDE